jgi:type II secretory pathway pseudopilin PulG
MPTGKSAQAGFTYLFVLMLIALIGMGLAAAGSLWHTDAQREREAELLFVGAQYRQAIRSYYERDDVAPPRLPQSVDELLEDDRTAKIVRHLRRAYRDPLTGGELALIQEPDTQGILGVYSQAKGQPIKIAGFLPEDALLSGASSYAEWRFVFTPPVAQAAPTGTSQSSPLQSKTSRSQSRTSQ